MELVKNIRNLIKREKELSDYELAIEISKLNADPSIMWSSAGLDSIIKRRINEHCKINNIPFHEYHGVLPIKRFLKKI